MTPIDEKPADSWRIPPPGLSWKLSAVRPGVMGQAALRIGERFQLRLPSHDGSDSLVVVLRRAEDRWEVIAPTSPETMLRLSQLRRSSSGERVLDLLAQRPVGIQRWAVVLLTSDAGIHWDLSDAERWREVQAAVGRGTLPVASVQITVKA